ncbi:ribosome biogenesis GTP-binding protein YihA/YsxC [Cytophagaceae bacterium DM2B3-1]|uniref:Probable GTP-binding protein EngB n=1 Tax=Xanthocytophaga flava TaxID=3048013 RepID=A0ABT7CQD3_9BACT|nr:ribosome biogenesis GTP-binding protein YihA/YsxC [Xanthocytophaga flavus]MDJ1495963.1 ribosome biogenesis GTP-binding protein YihA/YsxC [Xanthocytophaga flavus]
MKIQTAVFKQSNTDYKKCPAPTMPEYAFIGRSNVGKSSLINMITGKPTLAKTSQTPGKTQLINHFSINDQWYLVDLPGYGYAKASQKEREKWDKMIKEYLKNRTNLHCIFVLIDSRHSAQKIDMEFMQWLGENELPFAIIFTKTDKQSKTKTQALLNEYATKMLDYWEEMPVSFSTSSLTKAGKDEILKFIDELNQDWQPVSQD